MTEIRAAKDWVESSTEPTTTEDGGPLYPGVKWLDDSSDPNVLKRRNSANNGWVTIGPGFPHYVQDSEPASPTEGEFWWDTTNHLLKYFDGVDWTFEGYTPTPTSTDVYTEHFVDRANVDSFSGVAFGVNLPTKDAGNPLFPTSTETDAWDRDKNYASVWKDDSGWHALYAGLDTSGNAHGCYASSVDGETWTKPNLGLVSYGGTTDNNIVVSGALVHGFYDTKSARWVIVVEPDIKIYTAAEADGPYTLAKTISPALVDTTTPEGKGLVRRADGRWVAYYVAGHDSDDRSIYAYLSDTDDLTGSWTFQGAVLGAAATTNQFYKASPVLDGSRVLLPAPRYNATSEQIWTDLFASEDGLHFWQVDDQWIPVGTAGAWDDEMVMGGPLTAVGATWHAYYAGYPENHAAALPRDSKIGRASIDHRRIGQVGTTGTLTTVDLIVAAGATLAVNANAAGGTLDIEVQDATGTPLAGFAEADFDTITTDSHTHAPTWGGQPMPDGQTLRLKFVLSSATLYSYEVSDADPDPFTPADITDLSSWLDASQQRGFNQGQTITQWDDESGNGNHGANSTAYTEPEFFATVPAAGHRPAMRFNGTSDALVWATPAGAFTIFVVNKHDTTGAIQRVISSYDGGGAVGADEYIIDRTTTAYRFYRGTDGAITGGTPDTNWHYMTYRTGASGGKIRQDGTDIATTATAYSTGSLQMYIGEDRGGIGGNAEYFDGDIAEIILYARELTDSEVSQVEDYLAAKYGL